MEEGVIQALRGIADKAGFHWGNLSKEKVTSRSEP
jgi:hypothetical protein